MKRYEWYREALRNGADRSIAFDIIRDWEQESILMDKLCEMVKLLNLDTKNKDNKSPLEEFAISQIKDVLEEIKKYNEWESP